MKKSFRNFLCTLTALCACAQFSRAQTTFASITGTVLDATGSAVPNVTVTATNTQTGVKTKSVSNEAGNFTIAQLIDGTYTVDEAAGFKSSWWKTWCWFPAMCGAWISSWKWATLRRRWRFGGATLIETETARIGNVKTRCCSTLCRSTRAGCGRTWRLRRACSSRRQQRHPIRRQPGERGELVDRRNHVLRRGRQHADRTAGKLHRVVPGGQDRPGEQLRRIRLDGPSDDRLQIRHQRPARSVVRLLLHAMVPRTRSFATERATGIHHQPGGAIGGPV